MGWCQSVSEDLTLDDLMTMGHAVLQRDLEFEVVNDGKVESIKKQVTFRRLTYQEIDTFRSIPEKEPLRYASAVILTASVGPKFENVEQIIKTPHGFVRHYSALILEESGKDPFLGRG